MKAGYIRELARKVVDRTFDFENSQQRSMYPIVTDMNGKRAIGVDYLKGGLDNALITAPIDLTSALDATLIAKFKFELVHDGLYGGTANSEWGLKFQ